MGFAVRLAAALAALLVLAGPAAAQKRDATTTLFSVSVDGGIPNGPSTDPAISMDLRFAQLVAFESEASDLVANDVNGLKDVFAVGRTGSFADDGVEWAPGRTQLVSRGLKGKPANGPSFDAAVDGNTKNRAKCVAFLSAASNLVKEDTNKVTDAFVAKAPNFAPKRISLPDDRQAKSASTDVVVSGDCSRIAFVAGGRLFERVDGTTERLDVKGGEADPQYDSGDTNSLVFGASGGVYLLPEGAAKPTRVAKNARNPAYINRRRLGVIRRYLVYETDRGGITQIGYRELGGDESLVSSYDEIDGDGNSRDPTIFNSGFNVAFDSDATNLPTKSSGLRTDRNGLTDAYFWSNSDNVPQPVTILESVDSDNDPFTTGGRNVSTSQYRNYVLFESSANDVLAAPQVYMRYLGGI